MKLPKLDLSSLPDLNTISAMFGAVRNPNPGHDDSIVVIATVVFESSPPGGGII